MWTQSVNSIVLRLQIARKEPRLLEGARRLLADLANSLLSFFSFSWSLLCLFISASWASCCFFSSFARAAASPARICARRTAETQPHVLACVKPSEVCWSQELALDCLLEQPF